MTDPSVERKVDELLGQIPWQLPPVHLWNPPFCGDLDIRIARDGTWFYQGSPMQREAMVRLFSRVLRREGERYFLVTPVEKVGIQVDDAPFVAVRLERGDGKLRFITGLGDEVVAGSEHPLRVTTDPDTGEPRPYVHVRAGLEALISRSLFYELVELMKEQEIDGKRWVGVWSDGVFFPMGAV